MLAAREVVPVPRGAAVVVVRDLFQAEGPGGAELGRQWDDGRAGFKRLGQIDHADRSGDQGLCKTGQNILFHFRSSYALAARRRTTMKYPTVRMPSHGTPAIRVTRMPSTHHVVARMAAMDRAPSSDPQGWPYILTGSAGRPEASHFGRNARCVTKMTSHAYSPPNSEIPNR